MRNPLLLAAAVAIVSGCQTAPPTDHVPASQMIDDQIALSASTISQAQMRLHQTASPAADPALQSATPAVPVKPLAVATAVKPAAAPIVVMPASQPAPKIVEVVQLHSGPSPVAQVVADASKPSSSAKIKVASTASLTSVSPEKTATTVPVKIIPAATVPTVVMAKVTPPPKPLPEPWVVSANDGTLRRALIKWVKRAGWQLVWDASVDVPINVDAKFSGDFNTAVKTLFQSLSAAEVTLSAVLYSGNRVLRVTESGHRAQ